MIDIESYDILSSNCATLQDLSGDTSGSQVLYMTTSSIKAISFDDVKTKYTGHLSLSNNLASSVDALAVIGNQDVFIEFKNGKMCNEKQNVKNKVRDSLLILNDILKWTISDTRENLSFILVYNESKNPCRHSSASQQIISNHIMSQANTEEIKFGLDVFLTLYFKEVHTYTEAEFEAYLSRHTMCLE